MGAELSGFCEGADTYDYEEQGDGYAEDDPDRDLNAPQQPEQSSETLMAEWLRMIEMEGYEEIFVEVRAAGRQWASQPASQASRHRGDADEGEEPVLRLGLCAQAD